jgi:thioredoxin-related protein
MEQGGMYSLLYFGSVMCTQCRAIKRELENIHLPYNCLNTDEDYAKYNISTLPTLIVIDTTTGEEIKRITGFHTKEQILAWIAEG